MTSKVAVIGLGQTKDRLLDAARNLGPKATASEIVATAGLKNRKTVNYYFGSVYKLCREAGFSTLSPSARLVEAAKNSPAASARQIAFAAGYKSHKMINLYFETLASLKRVAGVYQCNKGEVGAKWPEVEFSLQDESLGIRIPTNLDENLAEEIGMHVGDGSLPRMKNPASYRYEVAGHKVDERRYYDEFVVPLMRTVFGITVKTHEWLTRYGVRINSKAIHTFKSRVVGLPIGTKDNIGTPRVVKESDNDIKAAFIRGLADTDFSLIFAKKHKPIYCYPRIVGSFSSRPLVEDIYAILRELGFNARVTFDVKKPNFRNKAQILTQHVVSVFGFDGLEKWISEIGFHSPKHMTKYLLWKEFGHCPPRLTTPEREAILRGENEI